MTRPLSVLLVEDSETDAELVLVELRRGGFDPTPQRVDNEAQLREALAEHVAEIVLCDHGLPGFSSKEALRIARDSAPDVPFVILSGTIGEEAAVQALKAGARDVVLKTNLARLGAVVTRELKEAENHRHQKRLEQERLELEARLIKLNEELRVSELRYRMLFDQNPLPALVYDTATHQIAAVNGALTATYGYGEDELLAMKIHDLLPVEDVELLVAFLARNPDGVRPADSGSHAADTWRHRYRDGTIVDVESVTANLVLEGRDHRIALFHNVTERKRAAAALAAAADEAVEASNMKSAFLANMSHEIRTPMNGVLGMTEVLLDMDLTAEQRECAQQLARSGEQMLSIINDILDISKIETGHLEIDATDFDLHELVKQACSVAGAQARPKRLALTVEIDDAVPRRVHGDGRRLMQVLLNLASNAVKFTFSGGVTVRVGAAPAADDAVLLRTEIVDSGIGIDPASLERMFEPFTQADASTTRVYGGTGLGLAISRELVALMGGTIGARSTPGGGSTFWFEVQLERPRRAAHAIVDATLPEPTWPRQPRVLVAEDNQVNQIVAARTLERCGCQVDIVENGRDALHALEQRDYDIVLMDCQMPEMDGYQATTELRRREHDRRHTPVIAMTAHAMDGDRERCLEAGMDDYISKPMRYAELADTLQRTIAAHGLAPAPQHARG